MKMQNKLRVWVRDGVRDSVGLVLGLLSTVSGVCGESGTTVQSLAQLYIQSTKRYN